MRLANEALALDPQNVTALATKAWLFEQDNQNRDALALAEQGLRILPAYPRFTKLQSIILNASGITAEQAAAQQRSTKFWTVNTPDWIVTFSRGPTEDELRKARAFDAMAAANISDANRDELAAWQKFGDTVAGMNASAGYYQWIGQADKAIALWKHVVEIDPQNAEAMEALEAYARANNLPAEAADWQLRGRKYLRHNCQLPGQEAATQLTAGQTSDAGRTLARPGDRPRPTLRFTCTSRTREPWRKRGALADWLHVSRCGQALAIAVGQLYGIDLRASAAAPLPPAHAQAMLALLNDARNTALHYDTASAKAYAAHISALEARIAAARTGAEILSDRDLHGPDYVAENTARIQGRQALEQAHFEHLRVLLSDHELPAAARYCLAAGPRTGIWHEEVTGPSLDLEYPIYLYLRPRIYHFQLWHYFGPATLEHYDATARLDVPADAR